MSDFLTRAHAQRTGYAWLAGSYLTAMTIQDARFFGHALAENPSRSSEDDGAVTFVAEQIYRFRGVDHWNAFARAFSYSGGDHSLTDVPDAEL